MREERFWAKVDRRGPDECWEWRAQTDRGGYGRFRGGQGRRLAHRYAYELLVGPIPVGLCLDHLCRNRRCVNPAHLEPVTLRENILRGQALQAMNAVKTHCINGHEFTPENTHVGPRAPGSTSMRRWCKTCQRLHRREAERKSRQAARAARLAASGPP